MSIRHCVNSALSGPATHAEPSLEGFDTFSHRDASGEVFTHRNKALFADSTGFQDGAVACWRWPVSGTTTRPSAQAGLELMTEPDDEIWVKLDAGTPAYMALVNRSQVPLEKVLENILQLGRRRPVVIQTLFSLVAGRETSNEEIAAYATRLQELLAGGAQIAHVQIYSASRPMSHAQCGHLPLKSLTRIAKTLREATGLRAEVF